MPVIVPSKAAVVREFFEEFESWGDVSFGLGAILPKGDFVVSWVSLIVS